MHIALNTITQGDCLDVLASLPAGSVDLAYLDPPFMTNRTHSSNRKSASAHFDDRWNTLDDYLDFLRQRIAAVYRALAPNGSILVHCDWHACHHIRIMLDDTFGSERFVNHLIWKYGLGGSSPRRFARKHDDILFYARSAEYYFAPPRVPATSRRMQGMTKKATDVLSIPSINNQAHERVGYPTQKPLALLTLLIEACAAPNAVVLDPFCGSGTTLVAAKSLGRQFLGIDANPQAVRIATERLAATDASLQSAGAKA